MSQLVTQQLWGLSVKKLILSMLLLASCSSTKLLKMVDGVEHEEHTTKLFGLTTSHCITPSKSVLYNSVETLASYGVKMVIVGVCALIVSFAFSSVIKSYTGQDVFNGFIIGSGCCIAAGITLIQMAAWWWYIVIALSTMLAYAGAKWAKNKGLF